MLFCFFRVCIVLWVILEFVFGHHFLMLGCMCLVGFFCGSPLVTIISRLLGRFLLYVNQASVYFFLSVLRVLLLLVNRSCLFLVFVFGNGNSKENRFVAQ